jgi:glycosyltransferase involved in cell wall biosynthesis
MICTYGERIQNVPYVLLPPRHDVVYVISWQCGDFDLNIIPRDLCRDDVVVEAFKDRGLSNNRNHALSMVKTPYAIIADDDLRYDTTELNEVIDTIKQNPDVDIFCFRAKSKQGIWVKDYPQQRYNYKQQPKGAYISSWEIVVKKTKDLPQFDPHYGIGAPLLGCGEEEIFIIDAAKKGLGIEYFPICLTRLCDTNTTGQLFHIEASVQRAKGAVFFRRYGLLLAILKAIKTSVVFCKTNKTRILKEMIKGIYYGWKYSI